jgi:hypothetical protein
MGWTPTPLADRPSGLTVPAHLAHQTIGDSMGSVEDRVKHGCPHVGWRGEPDWETIKHVHRNGAVTVEVWGWSPTVTDRRNPHAWVLMVAVDPAYEEAAGRDWRRTLLEKLRDGDWRNAERAIESVLADNDRVMAERAAEHREKVGEIADRLAFHLQREVGHHNGGSRHRLFAVGAPGGKKR